MTATSRRRFLLMLGAAGAVATTSGLAACGGGDGDAAASDGADEGTDSGASGGGTGGETPIVLALGEEYLLADLLALGITPVASTTNVQTGDGFAGLDEFDTTGIEPIPTSEPNLERLAGFGAEIVVANEFVVDYLGRDVLEGLGAELVVVPDEEADRMRVLGDAFDRREEVDALLADLDSAIEAAKTQLNADGRPISVATVYPGPTVAAWVDGPVDVPAMLLDLGYTLTPGAGDVDGEEGGRLYLSNEQIGVLDADILVAMQSDQVLGESDALDEIAGDPVWSQLPAVVTGNVITIDRLGYPGTPGRRRLVDDLVAQLG